MPGLYDGRHIPPIANSDSMCLMENWFEERSTCCLDKERKCDMIMRITKAHKGILSPPCDYKIMDLTTNLDSYRPFDDLYRNTKTKQQVMEKTFYEQAVREMEEKKRKENEIKIEPAPPSRERCICPIADLVRPDYIYEQPISFWSQNCRKVQGVSQIKKTFDTPFRKNAAFSTPVELSWDPTSNKPYEHDPYPNM